MIMGRKKIDINWQLVDNSLMAGCTGKEVASLLFNYHKVYDRLIQTIRKVA